MVEKLGERLQSVESAPLIASLMLGYRGGLEPGHWQVLKATGTIHLVAISGLHLGLVAIGAGFVIRRLLVWLPERWLSPAGSRLMLFALVGLASLGYALAAGFSVPTRRALIMVAVACWWVFTARRGQASDAVLFALFLVLVFDPLSPLDQGFWLSFGAVGILTLVFSGLLKPVAWWRSLIVAQVAIFAALWPILSALDQSQPLTGFFANLIAIPLVSLLIMPAVFLCALSLLVLPWLDWLFIGALDYLLVGLWWFLEQAAGLTLPSINPGILELTFAALMVAMALVLPFRAFRITMGLTMTLWLAAAAGVWGQKQAPENTGMPYPEIWVWDVGQGLSILVRQADQVLLYDTGPELEGVYSAAESVLIPNLRALGVARIDTLVISHADNDHSGGVPLLLENFTVDQLLTGEPERLADRLGPDAGVAIRSCAGVNRTQKPAFTSWQSGGSSDKAEEAVEGPVERPVKGNDASCVLTFSFNNGRQDVFLSGDITAETERLFVQENPAKVAKPDRFRIVLAPHHGSKTSSSSAWVSALAPDVVLFSAGYRHRYGHPHADIVERYEVSGSQLFNTATSGALRLEFKPEGVAITETRSAAPFWIGRRAGPKQMTN
jgi:competence protein ComEC